MLTQGLEKWRRVLIFFSMTLVMTAVPHTKISQALRTRIQGEVPAHIAVNTIRISSQTVGNVHNYCSFHQKV